MNRIHIALLSALVAVAAFAGMKAATGTVSLGMQARSQSAAPTMQQVAAREEAIAAQEAKLDAALEQQPPALPKMPHLPKVEMAMTATGGGDAAQQSAAPQEVVYVHEPAPSAYEDDDEDEEEEEHEDEDEEDRFDD